ncbi:MAG: hypothetical protein V1787_06150 [Candidatus Micrarchaeota archaeon]
MGLRHRLRTQVARHRAGVTRNEIVADAIFFIAGALLAVVATFIFDIHWSFYPGNTIFPPNKHIFNSAEPYYFAVLAGGALGIFLVKLVLLGIREDNEEVLEPPKIGKGRG